MSTHLYNFDVDVPIESVWKFANSMNEWPPYIPGYINHEILNDRESTWMFQSDLGIFKKKIHLKATILNWIEPKRIALDISGLSDRFTGRGYIQTKKVSDKKTQIIIRMEVNAEGTLVKMLKTVMKKNSTEVTEEQKDQIEKMIREVAKVNPKRWI